MTIFSVLAVRLTTLHMLLLVHPAIQAKQEGISSVLTADNLTANGWTQYFASDEMPCCQLHRPAQHGDAGVNLAHNPSNVLHSTDHLL